MDEHKPRARRRVSSQAAPLADERFRVAAEDAERSSRLPPIPASVSYDDIASGNLASSNIGTVQPYTGQATVPSKDSSGAETQRSVSAGAGVGVGAGSSPLAAPAGAIGPGVALPSPVTPSGLTAPAKPAPVKSAEDRMLRIWLGIVIFAIVLVGVGLFALRAMLMPTASQDTPAPTAPPALPATTGAGSETPTEAPTAAPLPATAATAPTAAPTQEPPPEQVEDVSTADPEPSSPSSKKPKTPKTPSGPLPPSTGATPKTPKPGPPSPVIF